jgi:hypothetical protein
MAKRPRLRDFAEEIVKLQRSANRREKQLEKTGKTSEIEKPEQEKPKSVKQAKEMIFKLESYLRHTSTDKKIRMAAERGKQIKENKIIDKYYKTAEKVMKKASELFMDELGDPINKKREAKGLPKRNFYEELQDFALGRNPKEIMNPKYRKEANERYKDIALKFKNDHEKTVKLFAFAGVTTLRMNLLHSLRNATSNNEFGLIRERIESMTNEELLDHYKANEGLYDRIMDESDTDLRDSHILEYTDEVMNALDID